MGLVGGAGVVRRRVRAEGPSAHLDVSEGCNLLKEVVGGDCGHPVDAVEAPEEVPWS